MAGGHVGEGFHVLRRGAAASAHEVDPALRGVVVELLGHEAGRFVVAPEFVGQPGVGVEAGEALRGAGQLLDEGAHLLRAKRAVEPDAQQTGHVRDAFVEGRRRLPGEGTPAHVNDRTRDHDRQHTPNLVEEVVQRGDGGLAVERVEDRLDQQDVHAVHEPAGLLVVGIADLVEGDVAKARVVDVGRDGERLVGGPDGAGDEARFVGGGEGVGGLAGDLGAGHVELVGGVFEAVVGLRDGRGAERVRLDDVGPGPQVLPVDVADQLRTRDREQVVVALQVGLGLAKAVAAKVVFGQVMTLNHRPHRAVHDEDAAAAEIAQFAQRGGHKGGRVGERQSGRSADSLTPWSSRTLLKKCVTERGLAVRGSLRSPGSGFRVPGSGFGSRWERTTPVNTQTREHTNA